jgi:hypothetical protein
LIILTKTRFFGTDAHYAVTTAEGFFQFYRLDKAAVRAISGKGRSKKTAEELLLDKKSFDLPLSSVSHVFINGEQSPWNITNTGTITILADGKKTKCLIHCYTTPAQCAAFFTAAGCENVQITEAQSDPHAVSLRSKKARKISHRYKKYYGFLGTAIALLLFLLFYISNYFYEGVVILFGITILSIALLIALQAYFVAAKAKRKQPENLWSNLFSSAILPPLLLILLLLRSYDFTIPPAVYISLPISALLITALMLFKYKKLRNRALAISLAFLTAGILFGAILGANYIFQKEISSRPGVVQELIVKRTGGRHRTTYYYVTVSFPPDNLTYQKVKTPSGITRNLTQGMPVQLSQKSGVFGIQWYEVEL